MDLQSPELLLLAVGFKAQAVHYRDNVKFWGVVLAFAKKFSDMLAQDGQPTREAYHALTEVVLICENRAFGKSLSGALAKILKGRK